MNLNAVSTNLSRVYGLVSDDPLRLQSRISSIAGGIGTQGQSSTSVKLSDYGRLQSSLTDLRRSTAGLDRADEVAAYKVASSTTAIQGSASKQVSRGQTLSVEVTRLARAQTLQSQAVADSDTTQLGGGTLRIEFGRINTSDNSFTGNGSATRSITIQTGDSSLNSIATSINRAGIGISARVSKDSNDQYRLELSSQQTGASQAFRITVDDTDGNDTDSAQGLSRLAFDPTSPTGVGRNLILQQAAQDAEATINSKPVNSSSNAFSNVVPGISLSARSTGTADITIGRDAAQGSKSAKALVAAFNAFQTQTSELGRDGLTRKVSADIDKTISKAETGSGQQRLTLADLGISKRSDGQLQLDEEKLQQAYVRDAEGATSLLASTAQSLGTVADNAQSGVLRKTSTALRTLDTGEFSLGGTNSRFSYRQTTSNLYGLAQYLSIAGLQ